MTDGDGMRKPNLQRLALRLALEQGYLTSDDLRPWVPDEINPKAVGTVLMHLKRRGWLEATGLTHTRIPSSHGRAIRIYHITQEGFRALQEMQGEGS